MASLNLKSRKIGSAVEITWNDALNQTENYNKGLNVGSLVLFGVSVLIVFMSSDFIIGMVYATGFFLVGNILLLVFDSGGRAFKRFTYHPNSVFISPTLFQTKSSKVNLADITRIELSNKGQWDAAKPHEQQRSQIRAWVQDSYSIVISENDWASGENHELRAEVDRTYQAMKAQAKLEKQAPQASPNSVRKPDEKPPETGDYGMPDY